MRIEGILVGRTEQKIMLYAEDVVFLLSNPVESLKIVKELLLVYGKVSGFCVNKNKSTIMVMNISVSLQKQIKEVKKPIKYLGINFVVPFQNETLIYLIWTHW